MSDSTTKLLLPYILASQAQKHVTHNEALRLLDGFVQMSVPDRDLTAPPGSPAEGDRYIVASGAIGDWSGWDDDVAMFADSAWFRLPRQVGWRAWVEDEDTLVVWNGATWFDLAGVTGGDGADGLSAYEVWLNQGGVGAESVFLASLVGADGTDGADGAVGATGDGGAAGADGADGVSITWQGDWLTATSYAVNDAVAHLGASYIAIAVHTSGAATEPGVGGSFDTAWDLLADKGDTGAAGSAGATGSAGADGAPGADGADGTSVNILGTAANTGALPGGATAGDGYIIDGDLHTWDGSAWINVGPIQGPAGLVWQGVWVTATAYVIDDAASRNGSAYICIAAHTSGAASEPGVGGSWAANWDLLAQKGDTGDAGADGAVGAQGITGIQGDPGADGADGAAGAAGADGADGASFIWEGAWVTATSYVVGDVVSAGGSSYIATADHTSGAASEPGVGGSWVASWDLVAQAGVDGADGADGAAGAVGAQGIQGIQGDPGADGADGATGATGADGSGLVWQGAWVTATAYAVGDVVSNSGSSYIATAAHTSGAASEPGVGGSWAASWDVVAAEGDLSAQGTIGTGPVILARRAINAQAGAYTLVLADEHKAVHMTSATAAVLTVPTNASVALPVGSEIEIVALGAGAISITGDTGVTVNGVSAGSADIAAQWQGAVLRKYATDTWLLIGSVGGVA